jgi:Holliday junction DNA helicase RuvB subunit
MTITQSADRLDPAMRDTAFDASLRPATFNEFVGQDGTCRHLKEMVQVAQESGDVIEHILLCGQSGLGKRTLAYMIAHAMGVNIKDTSGPTIEKGGDLAGLLTTLERGDVLFIDEIDRLPPAIEEYLYPAMKDYQLDIIIDQGPNARSIPLNLPRFTLIGATTRVETLNSRLRACFGVTCQFDRYTTQELQQIVLRSAGILDVPIDPSGALEIATRAQGTPRIANNLLRLAASHLRLKSAISHSDWCELLDVLTRELWSLAEARPDFEELPSWAAEVRATGAPVEDANQAAAGVEQIHTVLRSVVDRYGDDEDRVGFARMHSLSGGPGDMALAAADLAQKAATFRKGVRRLPLAIRNDQLLVGRHTRLSFNRTLRIPEDEREYPLPAGFGRLPILRVEDYAKRVPEQWLEQGGFIIPLYQREALFLEFTGVQWRPTIGKVSVGRVNAISGKEHDLKIRSHRQDYVVIPDQRWLDGINSGSGSVSQFVAMPLGKGYTIEAQITDEEKFGGFQLAIFDPRTGRFPEQDPKEQEAALAARKQRALRAAQQEFLNDLPSGTTRVVRAVEEQHYQDAAAALGMNADDVLRTIEGARLHLEDVLGPNGFEGIIPDAHLQTRKDISRAMFQPKERRFMPEEGSLAPHARRSAAVTEMGIARGGKIKQQIMEDTYGAESWDEAAFREVVIHIVNSEVYQHITGREAPPSPITDEQYRSCKIPWYSDYKEKAPSLSPVAVFKRVLSIGQVDKNRGIAKEEPPRREIQPEEILRIRTPTSEERLKALLDRTVESSKRGFHRIAAREASLALDLNLDSPFNKNLLLIRAFSNHRLGHHSDAETDASSCLKLQPDHTGALGIRAYSSLALGESLLAKNDAEAILMSEPDDHDGLYVLAEASLRLGEYGAAVNAAQVLLQSEPAHPHALRIQAEGLSKIPQL